MTEEIERRWLSVAPQAETWCVLIHGTDADGAPDRGNFLVVHRGESKADADAIACSLASIVADIVEYENAH